MSGVVNYALFLAVGARFMIHYCQLPATVEVFGLPIRMYGLLMALFLGMALVIVFLGGQIPTIVTDCLQGIFAYVAYAVIVVAILALVSFNHFREAMLARPPGESLINLFDTAKLTDFNILFVIITIVNMVYCRMAWQGTQGFNCAAKSPHEQKMAGVLSAWRAGYSYTMVMLLALAAYTYLNHPDFASGAAAVQQELQQIQADNPTTTQTLQTQMRVPVAIRHFLPVGVTGLFVALMIFLMVSTDTAYLHSWGSIFIQDVILPWRRKPFTPTRQVQLLRASILGVAVFAWLFSFFYAQTTYI
ncbi:MAG: hypothetical protein N3A53_02565, partial [Verrucomicrobiae bacterium]|nr:hypothetical protein [Verrucomicrobiae bacterium]